MRRAFALLVALLLAGAAALTAAPTSARAAGQRVVSVAGALTEIVYALNAGASLVGVDTTSTYPDVARALPQVGYQRTLSAEGILSLAPTLLLATEDAGPPEVLELLRQADTPILRLSGGASADDLLGNIARIAAALHQEEAGRQLRTQVEASFAEVREALRPVRERPRTMFLLNVGQGQLLVSGTGTKADAVIALAGGENAVRAYSGYKPLSAEAAVAAAPDALLLTTSGFQSAGGADGLHSLPGLALTPALRNGRVLHFDGLYLLGFGPRQAEAVRELALALAPLAAPAPAGGCEAGGSLTPCTPPLPWPRRTFRR